MKPTRNSFLASSVFSRRLPYAASLVISLCASHFASAASATWLASPTNATWDNSANWSAAFPNAATETATFNVASTFGDSVNPVIPSIAIALQNLTISGTAGAYVIGVNGGSALSFRNSAAGGNSISVATTVTNPQVVAAPIFFTAPSSTNGAYTFANNSTTASATLSITGAIIANTSGSRPGIIILNGTNTGNNTVSGVITSPGQGQVTPLIVKRGASTWILSNANAFTGTAMTDTAGNAGIQILDGVLIARNNLALGSVGNAWIGNRSITYTNNSSGATTTFASTVGGTLVLENAITLDNGLTLNLSNGGTIRSSGSNATNSVVKLATAAATSATLSTTNSGDVFTLGNGANDLTGGASDTVLHIAGPGTVLLAAAGNYAGAVSIDAGTLKLGNAGALATSGIAFGAGSTGKLLLDGVSTTIVSLNTDVTVGTPIIENNNAAAATLTVSNASGASTYAGVLQNGAAGGNLALTKAGASMLTLSGASTYSGGSTISGGSLLVTNSSGSSATGTGAVAVNGGTLGGGGFISGVVTVASAASVAPGNTGTGTLTVGGLILDSGSQLNYDITDTSNLDVITVNGSLVITGGQLNINGGTSAFTTNGTYKLIGGFTGSPSVSGLTVNALNKDITKDYNFALEGGFVVLKITNSASVVSYWNANANGNWSTGPWTSSTPNAAGAAASFGGGGTPITAPRTVTVNGAFTVGSIVFNNGTNAFTLAAGGGANIILNNNASSATVIDSAGNHFVQSPVTLSSNGTNFSVVTLGDTLNLSGAVSGGGTVTKIGNGTLSFTGVNGYTGDTQINAGTIAINNLNSLGIETALVTINAATLQAIDNIVTTRNFNITDATSTISVEDAKSFSISGVIGAGTGKLHKTGAGTLALSGVNTYSGGTVVSGGILEVNGDTALGPVPGAVVTNLTLDGGATLRAGAAVVLNANRSLVLNSGTATINTNGNAMTINGALSGTGGILNKTGAGTLTVNGVGTYSGGTVVSDGTLVIGSTLTGNITLANATTLQVPTGGAGNAIILSGASANASVIAAGISNGLTGTITGDFDQTLTIGNATQFSFGATTKQFQNFSGTLAIPTGATVRLSATSLANGGDNTTFDVNGFLTTRNNGTVALGALTGTGTVTMGGSGLAGQRVTYTIGAKGNDTLFSGVISDGDVINGKLINVVKTGSGIQTLTGASTYTGTTTISGGMLQIGNGGTTGSLGATAITVNSSTLSFNRSDAITVTNTITGNAAGILAQNGAGSLAITATDSVGKVEVHSGSIVVDTGGSLTASDSVSVGNLPGETGVLTVQGTGAITTPSLNVSGEGTGTVNQSGGTVTVNDITGGVTLAKNAGSSGIYHLDGGTLTTQFVSLGAGTSGVFDFNGGTLVAGADNTTFLSGITAANVQSGGAKIDTSGFSITIDQPLLNAGGGLTKSGSGTLSLAGANTYTGATTVTAGTLVVNGSSIADSGKLIITSGVVNVAAAANETVNTLYFGTVPQAAGTYGSTASAATHKDDVHFSGSGIVTVSATGTVSGYDSWASSKGLDDTSPDRKSGVTEDPDNDGIKNLLEFVMDGNPRASDPATILPKLDLTSPADFKFTFKRRDDSESPETTLIFQYGSNLTGWTNVSIGASPGAGQVSILENGAAADDVTVTISRTSAVSGKLFGRLQAVR